MRFHVLWLKSRSSHCINTVKASKCSVHWEMHTADIQKLPLNKSSGLPEGCDVTATCCEIYFLYIFFQWSSKVLVICLLKVVIVINYLLLTLIFLLSILCDLCGSVVWDVPCCSPLLIGISILPTKTMLRWYESGGSGGLFFTTDLIIPLSLGAKLIKSRGMEPSMNARRLRHLLQILSWHRYGVMASVGASGWLITAPVFGLAD